MTSHIKLSGLYAVNAVVVIASLKAEHDVEVVHPFGTAAHYRFGTAAHHRAGTAVHHRAGTAAHHRAGMAVHHRSGTAF